MRNLLTKIGGENTVRSAVNTYFEAVENDPVLRAKYGDTDVNALRDRYVDALSTLFTTGPVLVTHIASDNGNRVAGEAGVETGQFEHAASILTQAFAQLGVRGEALGELHLRLQLLQPMITGNPFGAKAVVSARSRTKAAQKEAAR